MNFMSILAQMESTEDPHEYNVLADHAFAQTIAPVSMDSWFIQTDAATDTTDGSAMTGAVNAKTKEMKDKTLAKSAEANSKMEKAKWYGSVIVRSAAAVAYGVAGFELEGVMGEGKEYAENFGGVVKSSVETELAGALY